MCLDYFNGGTNPLLLVPRRDRHSHSALHLHQQSAAALYRNEPQGGNKDGASC